MNRYFQFNSIGVKKASTFKGFCAKHDNDLFSSIESGEFEFNNKNTCLISYRVFCHELHDVKLFSFFAHESKKHVDKGLDILEQMFNQDISNDRINSYNIVLDKMSETKKKYDSIIINESYSDFRWLAIRLNCELPIVSAGTYVPEYDFENNRLYNLDDSSIFSEYPCMSINILNDNKGAFIVLGWVVKDDNHVVFAESFLKQVDKFGADFLIKFGIMSSRNIFCRPSWWKSLDDNTQKYLANKKETRGGPHSIPMNLYSNNSIQFDIKWKIIDVKKGLEP